jgi:hypothetical protein
MSGDSEPAPFGHIMPTSKLHARGRGMSIAGFVELDAFALCAKELAPSLYMRAYRRMPPTCPPLVAPLGHEP